MARTISNILNCALQSTYDFQGYLILALFQETAKRTEKLILGLISFKQTKKDHRFSTDV